MRNVPLLLAHVAALLTLPACSAISTSNDRCHSPGPKSVAVSPDVACAIASEENGRVSSASGGSSYVRGPTCSSACGPVYTVCGLPDDYERAYVAAQPVAADAGTSATGDAGAGVCPAVTAPVSITCSVDCTGRRTEGAEELAQREGLSTGDYLAACAHLEAVSVQAFERLAAELAAHGAPASLVGAATEAAREEVRHTEVTAALARRFGSDVKSPSAPPRTAPRSLFDVALENAVEGCVRETYGAALALVRAKRAADPDVRRALADIAREECGHADLSWQIAAWADAHLGADEREQIASAVRAAVAALSFSDERLSADARRSCGVPPAAEQARLASLVDAWVIRAAA